MNKLALGLLGLSGVSLLLLLASIYQANQKIDQLEKRVHAHETEYPGSGLEELLEDSREPVPDEDAYRYENGELMDGMVPGH